MTQIAQDQENLLCFMELKETEALNGLFLSVLIISQSFHAFSLSLCALLLKDKGCYFTQKYFVQIVETLRENTEISCGSGVKVSHCIRTAKLMSTMKQQVVFISFEQTTYAD